MESIKNDQSQPDPYFLIDNLSNSEKERMKNCIFKSKFKKLNRK